jgi:hypothetical protein
LTHIEQLEKMRRKSDIFKKIYYNSMKSIRKTPSKASVSPKKTLSSKASVSPKKTVSSKASVSPKKTVSSKASVIRKITAMPDYFYKNIVPVLYISEIEKQPPVNNPKTYFKESNKYIKLDMFKEDDLQLAIRFSNVMKKYPEYLGTALVLAYRNNYPVSFLAIYNLISMLYKAHMKHYREAIAFLIRTTKTPDNIIYKICKPLIDQYLPTKFGYNSEEAFLSIFEDNRKYAHPYIYIPINAEYFRRNKPGIESIEYYIEESSDPEKLISDMLKNQPGVEYIGLSMKDVSKIKRKVAEMDEYVRNTSYDSYLGF